PPRGLASTRPAITGSASTTGACGSAWPGATGSPATGAWPAGGTTATGARAGMGDRWLIGAGARGPAHAARTRVARSSPAPAARTAAGDAVAMPSAARARVSWPRFMGTTSNGPAGSFGAGLQRNESYRIEHLQLPALRVAALDQVQRLSRAVVDRGEQPRAGAKLLEQRLRDLVARGGHDDRVVGRHLCNPEPAIAIDQAQVPEPKAAQVRARRLVQAPKALDRHDVAHEMREERRLVSAARADLEHPRRRSRRRIERLESELEHARDGAGSRDRLAEPYRQGNIVVGAARQPLVDEGV